MFFQEGFKLCSLVFNTNDTVMGKFLFIPYGVDITISYSFIELLKCQLLTLLWRACLHLLDPLPSGTVAADLPSTQSESALALQSLLTGQGLQPQPAWGLLLTSLWFI